MSTTAEYTYCPYCATALVPLEESGRVRQACPRQGCGFIHYGNPLPIVAAIVELPSGVVLVRAHGWPEKIFGLVTGFLEAGESPEDGVLREVQEELGLSAGIEGLVGAYAFAVQNQVILAYHLRSEGTIELGSELESYKVIPVERLRPWPFGTGLAVEAWLHSRRVEAGKK
jgi:NAD+ diphosphatase